MFLKGQRKSLIKELPSFYMAQSSLKITFWKQYSCTFKKFHLNWIEELCIFIT